LIRLGRMLLVVTAFFFAACSDDRPESPIPVPGEDTAVEKPPVAPPKSAAPEVPEGNLRGDVSAGETIYGRYCVTCHGAGGKGDGPAGKVLVPKPADHSNPAVMKARTDQDLYRVILRGGAAVGKSPSMAPWGGVLNDGDIRDVIAFIRSLSGT